ncbi:MAG: hypothetical protein AB7S70_00345 [Hyphomicrobium sp.]|uniref:hypothetical protein n=1 Tax=Hyphomicrobium sp. TaxID=82 RepID=UPI003D0D08A8
MIIGDALFIRGHLSAYLQKEKDELRNYVDRAIRDNPSLDEAALVKLITERGAVATLAVDFSAPTKDVRPIKTSVNDYGRHIEIDGVRATKTFSFTGEPILFQLQPNSFTSVIPHGRVSGQSIMIGWEGRNDAEAIKRALGDQEKMLAEYIERQRADIEAHNAGLEQRVAREVKTRLEHIGSVNRLKDII